MALVLFSAVAGYQFGWERFANEDQEEVREETPAPEPVEETYEENESEIEEEKSLFNPGQNVINPAPLDRKHSGAGVPSSQQPRSPTAPPVPQ